MNKILQSPWVAAALGMVLYLGTVVLCWHPQVHVPEKVEPKKTKIPGPSWAFYNPEIEQLVGELKKEKQAVADREKQLNDLAARLQAERQELNQVTQTVQELQSQFDHNVVRVEEQETANLKKLAKVYSGMAPDSAVLILKQMDEDTVVKMLALMKDVDTSPLLEAMAKQGEAEAKRAASFSERLRLAMTKPLSAPAVKP